MFKSKTKKKNRLSLSCNYCKKRKVKCDRKKPCSSCVKYNGGAHCQFDDVQWNHDSNSAGGPSALAFQIPEGVNDRKSINPTSKVRDLKKELKTLGARYAEVASLLQNDSIPTHVSQPSQTPSYQPDSSRVESGRITPFRMPSNNEDLQIVLPPISNLSVVNRDEKGPVYQFKPQPEKYVPPWDPKNNISSVGINPYYSPDEVIYLAEGYTPTYVHASSKRIYNGILSWYSIVRKDNCLRHSWDFLLQIKTKSQPNSRDPSETKPQQETEERFQSNALSREGYDDVINYKEALAERLSSEKKDSSEFSVGIGGKLSIEDKLYQELNLIKRIESKLPRRKVIQTYVNKFFRNVYAYTPIVDEAEFKVELTRILGSVSRDTIELNVEKRLDLAYVGILLIILRMGYLSLLSNKNDKNPDVRFLLKNPIEVDMVDLSYECLNQFDIYKKSSLLLVQFAFLTRLYRFFSPEDSDGTDGSDSSIFTGMIVNMSYSIGLHREPESFPDRIGSPRTDNLGRKIWFFLLIMELIQSYMYGNPLTINPNFFDTKLPYYKSGNENVLDTDLEQNVVSSFKYLRTYYDRVVEIMGLILNLESPPRADVLFPKLNSFEIFLNQTFGSLLDFMVPFEQDNYPYPFVKTMKCKNLLNMKYLVLTLHYHIFLHYETRGNSADHTFFYFRKVITHIYLDFLPFMEDLIDNNYKFFGDAGDLIMNPIIQALIHRTITINLGILSRINQSVYQCQKSENHTNRLLDDKIYEDRFISLRKLSKIVEKITIKVIKTLSKLTDRYYYAWRIIKAHSLWLKVVCGELIYKSEETPNLFHNLFSHQIDQLLSLTMSCASKLGLTETTIPKAWSKSSVSVPTPSMNSMSGISEDFGTYSRRSTEISNFSSVPNREEELINTNSDDFKSLDNAEIDRIWIDTLYSRNDKNPTNRTPSFTPDYGSTSQGAAINTQVGNGAQSGAKTGGSSSTANLETNGTQDDEMGMEFLTMFDLNMDDPSWDLLFNLEESTPLF